MRCYDATTFPTSQQIAFEQILEPMRLCQDGFVLPVTMLQDHVVDAVISNDDPPSAMWHWWDTTLLFSLEKYLCCCRRKLPGIGLGAVNGWSLQFQNRARLIDKPRHIAELEIANRTTCGIGQHCEPVRIEIRLDRSLPAARAICHCRSW